MPVSVKEAGVWKNRAASVKSLNIFKKSEGSAKVGGVYKGTNVNTDAALILEFLGGNLSVYIANSSTPIPYRTVRAYDGVVTQTGTLNNGVSTVTTPDSTTVKYRLELIEALTPLNPAQVSAVMFNINNKILNILHIDDDLYGFNTYPRTSSTVLVDVPTNLPPSITSLDGAFSSCYALNSPSVSGWNTSNVTNMNGMFYNARAFNQNISGWNTGNVTNMGTMFYKVQTFNQNISGWNTGKVTNMAYMFYTAQAFNQNISGWDTSNVTDMYAMFQSAHAFNQNISGWDTSNVTTMNSMFHTAQAFNQNISGWDVAKVTNWNFFSTNSPLSSANTPPKFR